VHQSFSPSTPLWSRLGSEFIMSAYAPKSPCNRTRVPSPSTRGSSGAGRSIAAHSVVPQHDSSSRYDGTHGNVHDLMSRDVKWAIGVETQQRLKAAVKVEDFHTAAKCRSADCCYSRWCSYMRACDAPVETFGDCRSPQQLWNFTSVAAHAGTRLHSYSFRLSKC
jgi:hypothetical protein